ncbi:Hypothetical protein, putative [Bodo saltans]|uniref:Uncharacterized protein n=1 Tax=Bodo saltans TaxID=75058 RepID=A0A0S4JC96_BODSA|nr:Hypothetical protein, putative [Bodo saltans]|eukprot:CUG87986.1 Hypothetical protein, putative [Bodo saltans]
MGKSSVDAKIRIARRRAAKADGVPLSVAIVGTGIAGETAAYLLSRINTCQPSSLNPQAGWDLRRVYEARAAPGLHANSIELDGHHVDVPLRAVSPHYYANLFQLYQHLGVGMQPVDYSTSTSRFHPSGASSPVSTVPTFRYQNALVLGWALPFLVWSDVLSWTKVCAAFVIVRDFMFLVFTGPYLLREGVLEDITGKVLRNSPKESSSSSRYRSPTSSHNDDTLAPSLTFGQLLRYLNYSSVFTDAFLYPIFRARMHK